MIHTIHFDFGNVLAFFDHGRAVREFASFTDMDEVELALAVYGSAIAEDYECGKISTAAFVREAILNARMSCSAQEFLAFYNDIFWRNPEVCDLVPRLKPRYRLVLASNTNEAHFLRYTNDFADVLAHFDHVVPSHQAGARKPHAEFYEYLKQFAFAPTGNCLFIDDLPVNVEAAERAGFRGLVYTANGTLADRLREAGVEIG
jgi:putative hydrolase of the HAD superfamily